MKKTILLFILIIILCLICRISVAQTPGWLWAEVVGGNHDDNINSIAVDAGGNTYITGNFRSQTISFDSIVLTNTDASAWPGSDIFLVKYDLNQNVVWAKKAGGTYDDVPVSFALDTSGNIFLAGYFQSPSVSFDSVIITNVDVTASSDNFIAKYDNDGNALWAKGSGGTYMDYSTSVASDRSGNAYLAGYFMSHTIQFDSITLTNMDTVNWGFEDIFLAKYDPLGNLDWVKKAGGTLYDEARSVATDPEGHVYLTGYFFSPAIFDYDTLKTDSFANIFLAKYDTDGNMLYTKNFSGSRNDIANSIALDGSGNIYIAGGFKSDTLHLGNIKLTNADTMFFDIFISKFDGNGNALWAESGAGVIDDLATNIAVDTLGNAFMVGYFYSPFITFDSDTLLNSDNSGSNFDFFLVEYDAGGSLQWINTASGLHWGQASSVAVDSSGKAYIAGNFNSSSIVFGSTVLTNMSAGSTDGFFAKSEGSITGINELSDPLNISVYPNPSSDKITILASQKSEIEILNIQGQIIGKITANENHKTIDVSGFSNGMYFVKIITVEGIAVKKFIKE
jgi:hypothetical protein